MTRTGWRRVALVPAGFVALAAAIGLGALIGTNLVPQSDPTPTVDRGAASASASATPSPSPNPSSPSPSESPGPPTGNALADAGLDIDAARGGRVRLDGTASRDPDSETLEYDWRQVHGPDVTDGAGSLAGAKPVFDAPNAVSTIVFELRVSDGAVSGPDRVQVNVLDDPDRAIFVDGDLGSDDGDGTRSRPLRTIAHALTAARDAADLYVMARADRAAYDERAATVEIPSGTSIYGGYGAGWLRDVEAARTRITGARVAIAYRRLTSDAWLSGLDVVATPAGHFDTVIGVVAGRGRSDPPAVLRIEDTRIETGDIGVVPVGTALPAPLGGEPPPAAANSGVIAVRVDLELTRSTIHVGSAGRPANAPGGALGASAAGSGQDASGQTGGASGLGCLGGPVMGRGGDGGGIFASGSDGGGPNGGAGGTFGADGGGGRTGAPTAGGNGGLGGQGFSPRPTAELDALGLRGDDARLGERGTPADGGGGGGGGSGEGFEVGGGGGGGGGNGCGGGGGLGGLGGGGSVGIVLLGEGRALIASTSITAGPGGPGGTGGTGGAGGGGSQGGRGAPGTCFIGCAGAGGSGGMGGEGAWGGNGGGGAGGPSIGVYVADLVTVEIDDSAVVAGSGGAGGVGGAGGQGGIGGMVLGPNGDDGSGGRGGSSYALYTADAGTAVTITSTQLTAGAAGAGGSVGGQAGTSAARN